MIERMSAADYLAMQKAPGGVRGAVVTRAASKKDENTLTADFLLALRLAWPDAPRLESQYRWAEPERQFRADFAYPPARVAIELDGGVFGGGAHASIGGILRDIDKSQWASALNWRVFRLTTKDLEQRPGQCIDLLRRAIEGKNAPRVEVTVGEVGK